MENNTQDLERQAAATLRHVARDEALKAYVLGQPALHDTLLKATLRFIGGETLPHCLAVASTVQAQGHAITIDYMGESTRNTELAQQAVAEFSRISQAIVSQKLDASISFDLSHIGLAVDRELAYQNAVALAEQARAAGLEMMISMEGSEHTSEILEMHRQLCARFDNIGITLQAYLYRTADDLAAALERLGRIRLVKGAYEEAAGVARPHGAAVDAAYRTFTETLLASGHACSIATHDPALLAHAHQFIQEQKLNPAAIEFEMLYGVTRDRLAQMHDLGYRTRIYLPYGYEWYLYLCHRLAEYPPNIYQALVDALRAK